MSTNGPAITIEAFELKYPKDIKLRFDEICKLASSGDNLGARALVAKLSTGEVELFKQYPSEAKVYNSLLTKRIEEIDHRLAVMKEDKKQVLSQYNKDTAAGMRQFKPADQRPAAKVTATPSKKRSACTIM